MANFTTDGKICIERKIEASKTNLGMDDLISRFYILETSKWITKNNFNKICLQFPDDLLGVCANIYEEIKNRTSADLYILGDTSYASCCVDSVAAMHVQGEAVIHYGHTCFTAANIPVFTVLPKRQLNIDVTKKLLIEHFSTGNDKLCLFYGAEYEYCKDELISFYFQRYPECSVAFIEIEEVPNRYLGRVVRNVRNDTLSLDDIKDCSCVYVGSRGQTLFNFTISIPACKWYLLDPDESKISCSEETTWSKRRRYLVEKCKDANVIGILVCKLAGDQTKHIISRMKQLCKVNGKKSYIISVGKPNVAKLANFPEIDIYVMIACPENDLYSNRDFYKPIVYPFELEVALNSNREPYYNYHITDYDQLLPGKKHYCEVSHIKDTTDVSLITGNIRETKIQSNEVGGKELVEKQNWTLENIGSNLQNRSWTGLEQKLGETEVKQAEEGRKGIPLQYSNEPE
ncbi:2-(3-amino-3-carboxypropyl)histidine synthase subunit 2 [Maniola hyperantus]|uniref:2-(3-amino-3-carboxypropyl)histidine synthase subunit 2 n=1 Tax=Aphantopus hyperantus TaxID=2795564 RepID=UPI0015689D58|nr:2-(3-amino-3-carboxypropyl)histidine synthase subunit 2 [Maniola hyperantus]